jgi:hypothetical protein
MTPGGGVGGRLARRGQHACPPAERVDIPQAGSHVDHRLSPWPDPVDGVPRPHLVWTALRVRRPPTGSGHDHHGLKSQAS